MRPLVAATVAAALAGHSWTLARATPQVGSALTLGAGAIGLERDGRALPVVHLGARADVLFLRERDRDMAIGPYVDVATEAFRSFEVGAGADWLVPVTASFPIVFSAGGAVRTYPGLGWEPGLSGALFFGSRGYNFHSWYGLTGGLFIQVRRSLGSARDSDVLAGVELDLSLFAYPVLLFVGALRR